MSRWFGWLALVMLAGCDYVHSRPGAPFKLGKLRGQVWALEPTEPTNSQDEDTDPEGAHTAALVVLAEEEFPCPVYRLPYVTVYELISEGKGLFFRFDVSPAESGGIRDWEGLWTSSLSYAWTEGRSKLHVQFFSDGIVYPDMSLYDTFWGASWVDLDVVDETGASGTFDVGYWHGRFAARSCGEALWEDTSASNSSSP